MSAKEFKNDINVTSGTVVGDTINVIDDLGAFNCDGDIVLQNGEPRILFKNNGVGAPTFTNRSAGTKIVLIPSVSGSAVDFAIGIESSVTWFSVPTTSQSFKFYGGTTEACEITGAGNLNIAGTLTTGASNLKLKTIGGGNTSSDNSLSIMPGFRENTPTNNYITYDMPSGGTHYFWDSVECSGNLTVGGDVTNGTYSPTIGDGTNNFVTSLVSGEYRRIGNMINVYIRISWTGKGSAIAGSSIQISLPFTIGSNRMGGSCNFMNGVTFSTQLGIAGSSGATFFGLFDLNSGTSPSARLVSHFSTGGEVQFGAFYFV